MSPEQIFRIISPLITLILSALIKYFTEKKSKLISFIGHISSFTIENDNNLNIFTHSVVVRNAGKKAAYNVRLGHFYLPPNITINPNIEHSTNEESKEIIFPIIVPKEQVTISYLYFPPTTWNNINNYTKSDEGFAKILNVIPTSQPSKLLTVSILLLTFVGASFLIYLLLKTIKYFI